MNYDSTQFDSIPRSVMGIKKIKNKKTKRYSLQLNSPIQPTRYPGDTLPSAPKDSPQPIFAKKNPTLKDRYSTNRT